MSAFIADANIFLRFLTKDILSQAQLVRKRIKEAENGKYQLVVLHVTIVEILYQLENRYGFNREEAVEKLYLLFVPQWIAVEEKQLVFDALDAYKTNKIDFVDLLIWATAKKDGMKILSFDRDFDKLSPKLRLAP